MRIFIWCFLGDNSCKICTLHRIKLSFRRKYVRNSKLILIIMQWVWCYLLNYLAYLFDKQVYFTKSECIKHPRKMQHLNKVVCMCVFVTYVHFVNSFTLARSKWDWNMIRDCMWTLNSLSLWNKLIPFFVYQQQNVNAFQVQCECSLCRCYCLCSKNVTFIEMFPIYSNGSEIHDECTNNNWK